MCNDTCIWQGRLVKMLDEHTWAMSRVGDHDDWDYASDKEPRTDCAVAGTFGLPVDLPDYLAGGYQWDGEVALKSEVIRHIRILGPDQLLFEGERFPWVMHGNPMDGGFVQIRTPILTTPTS